MIKSKWVKINSVILPLCLWLLSGCSPVHHIAKTDSSLLQETFKPNLIDKITQVALTSKHNFNVYIPEGGLGLYYPDLKTSRNGPDFIGWEFSEKDQSFESADYKIQEGKYSAPDSDTYTSEIINGVKVYEHVFANTTIMYYFKKGTTGITVIVSGPVPEFPHRLLNHLIPLQPK